MELAILLFHECCFGDHKCHSDLLLKEEILSEIFLNWMVKLERALIVRWQIITLEVLIRRKLLLVNFITFVPAC